MPLVDSQPIRVLLIDDHSVVRTGLRLIIQGSPGMAMAGEAEDRKEAVLIKAVDRVHAGEAWLDPSIMAGVLNEESRGSKAKKSDPEARKIASLTNREREVVALIGQGIKNKEVAELLIYAMRNGLASLPR